MITYLHFVMKAVIGPILPVLWLVFMVSISTCDAALNIELGGRGGVLVLRQPVISLAQSFT